MEYVIRFQWDEDASVWIATSSDIPGLVLEAGSFDTLMEKVRLAVPELLELNKENVCKSCEGNTGEHTTPLTGE